MLLLVCGHGCLGGYGAAVEQGPGDELGVVPGGGVADARGGRGSGRRRGGDAPSADRPGGRARTRRSSPARPRGSRRGRRRGCASPGWRRRIPRRRASRGRAPAPASGGIRSGWAAIDWKAARRVCGNWRATERNGRAAFAQGEPRSSIRAPPPGGLAERARPEAGGGEGRDRGRPAEAAHFQRHPAAERVAGDVRPLDPVARALLVHRAGQVGGGRLDLGRQRRRVAEARACRSRAPRARLRAAGSPAPRRCGCRRDRGVSSSGSRP